VNLSRLFRKLAAFKNKSVHSTIKWSQCIAFVAEGNLCSGTFVVQIGDFTWEGAMMPCCLLTTKPNTHFLSFLRISHNL
jgi:hypothetical protein